jgi:hypothetical protein
LQLTQTIEKWRPKITFRRLTANVVARFSPNRTGNGVAVEFALVKLIEKKKTVVMSQKMSLQLIAARRNWAHRNLIVV